MGLIYCFRYRGRGRPDNMTSEKKIWKPLQTMLISEGKVSEVESSKDKGLRCVCGTAKRPAVARVDSCECST